MPQHYQNIGDVIADILGQVQPGIIAGQQNRQFQEQQQVESRRLANEAAFKRYLGLENLDINRQELDLKLNPPEKPLPPAKNLNELITRQTEKDLQSGTITLDEAIERQRRLTGKETKTKKLEDVPAGILTETAKQFYESRQQPILDKLGRKTGTIIPPLIGNVGGVQHDAPDSLRAIISQIMGGQQQAPPIDTGGIGQTIQGFPIEQARGFGRKAALAGDKTAMAVKEIQSLIQSGQNKLEDITEEDLARWAAQGVDIARLKRELGLQ